MKKFLWAGAAVLLVFLVACGGLKSPETYEISGDEVKSLTAVVGDLKMTGTSVDTNTNRTEKRYTYSDVEDTPEKMKEYVMYLHEEEGFYVLEDDIVFGTATGEASMAKLSRDGDDILFGIAYRYDESTIELQIVKGKGTLNVWE